MRGDFLSIPNIRNRAVQVARNMANLALLENKPDEVIIDTLVIPEDSKYLFSNEINIESTDEIHNIDYFKLPSTPEISDYWYEKISNFYTNLSTEAKSKRFHTSVEKFDDFSKSHKRLLLATNGRTISYGAIDRQTDELVAHVSRVIVKKSDPRLQEVAVVTSSSIDYLHKGLAKQLVESLIEDARENKVDFLEFYTSNTNTPVNNLNNKIIYDNNLTPLRMKDPDDPQSTYTYFYIGNPPSLEEIKTKIETDNLMALFNSDVILTPEAKTVKNKQAINRNLILNRDELILERAKHEYIFRLFEEVYTNVHPVKLDEAPMKQKRRRSLFFR
jgi:hypothetical protein